MSMRQYKKRAKRARDLLIQEFGYRPSDFWYPKRSDEFSLSTSEPVDGAHPIWGITLSNGIPIFLPELFDYWGEANDPQCCVDVFRENHWWHVCDDSYARKEFQ